VDDRRAGGRLPEVRIPGHVGLDDEDGSGRTIISAKVMIIYNRGLYNG
jgi:hypothetical protein